MRVIILEGRGRSVPAWPKGLVSEENDITVIDTDTVRLQYLQDRLDLRTVCGNAAHPSVLREAGAEDADLVIAVTQSDQTNLVACKARHRVSTSRPASPACAPGIFWTMRTCWRRENFAVDFAICPEQVISDYIHRLIRFPEALQVMPVRRRPASVWVAVRAYEGGFAGGKPIREMRSHLPVGMDARIAAIFRRRPARRPRWGYP